MPVQDDITAIILAGGKGTRLSSVVNDRPKVLAPVNGRPFLGYLLEFLEKTYVNRVVISTGYMADEVEAAFGNSYEDMPIQYSREAEPLGTGGALRLAMELVNTDPVDPVLVLNGDSICTFNPPRFLAGHREFHASASLVLARVPDTSRFGKVKIDGDFRIQRFEEKSASGGPGLINAGVYLINRQRGLSIPANIPISLEKDIFPQWIGKGFFGFDLARSFIDIGTPESYREAEPFFKS